MGRVQSLPQEQVGNGALPEPGSEHMFTDAPLRAGTEAMSGHPAASHSWHTLPTCASEHCTWDGGISHSWQLSCAGPEANVDLNPFFQEENRLEVP